MMLIFDVFSLLFPFASSFVCARCILHTTSWVGIAACTLVLWVFDAVMFYTVIRLEHRSSAYDIAQVVKKSGYTASMHLFYISPWWWVYGLFGITHYAVPFALRSFSFGVQFALTLTFYLILLVVLWSIEPMVYRWFVRRRTKKSLEVLGGETKVDE